MGYAHIVVRIHSFIQVAAWESAENGSIVAKEQLLLSTLELPNLSLLSPPETVTLKRHMGESTIELVFPSSDEWNTLTAGCLREDLDHGSDHYPINTAILFSLHVSPHVPKPLWRKSDKTIFSLRARELD